MNELAFKGIFATCDFLLVAYTLIGLIKFWSRSDKFLLLHEQGVVGYPQYFITGLKLIIVVLFVGLVTLKLYQAEVLHYSLIGLFSLALLIASPRFILDISRGLKYNTKTGELARIKELEDQLKDK